MTNIKQYTDKLDRAADKLKAIRERKDKPKDKKKRERADSKVNKAKVVKEVLKHPLKSQREIAKAAGVSKGTVFNKLGELGQTKDKRIQGIIDKDLEIVTLWQQIISDRLQDEEELKKISARDVSWIIKENTARYTLFAGDATDKNWWLNWPIWELDTDSLLAKLNELREKKNDKSQE